MNKWLYVGKSYHKRFHPREHSFLNSVFYLRFPLSQISKLENLIFSVDRWNLISFFAKDHANRDGGSLWDWAINKLRAVNIADSITEIELQTFPRILGFVFNPISFWYCYSGRELIATIAEVNNTFGDTHSYIIQRDSLIQKKVLHVSPFFQVTGHYDFSFSNSTDSTGGNTAVIKYYHENQLMLLANIGGTPINWSLWNLFRVWLGHPLMTFTVIFYIHLHAFILYIKGIKFYGKNGKA